MVCFFVSVLWWLLFEFVEVVWDGVLVVVSCEACSLRCVAMGTCFVLWCRCAMFVSNVHPVIVQSALFRVCSFVMFLSEVMGTTLCWRVLG